MSAGEMLSAKSLAKRWDCKLGYVYQQIQKGELESIRFGRHMVRTPIHAVERFEEKLCSKKIVQNSDGGSENTGDAGPPSSEADLSADASVSMKATKAQRAVLSGS